MAALAGAALLVPSTAHAGSLADLTTTVTKTVSSTVSGTCVARSTQQRFLSWSDVASYWFVPASSDWVRAGGAVQVGTGFTLPAGASVTTPTICLGLDSPTLRLLARSANGGTLKVEVVGSGGNALVVGRFAPAATLAPSPIMLVVANLLVPLSASQSVGVQLRLTASGGSVDATELWVDPFKRV